MGFFKSVFKAVTAPLRIVEKNVVRPIIHNPVAGLVLGSVPGMMMANHIQQQSQGRKAMQAYHQNAENMYNKQSSQIRNEQARIGEEQARHQGRHNRGLARANRARAGSIFGDENDGRLGH